MPDPLMNTMPRAGNTLTPTQAQFSAAQRQPDVSRPADDQFSRTLERRMNGEDRRPEERRPETRSAQEHRPAERRPVSSNREKPAEPASRTASSEPVPGQTTVDVQPGESDITVDSSKLDSGQTGTEPPAPTEAGQPTALPASIAALMPHIAAHVPQIAAHMPHLAAHMPQISGNASINSELSNNAGRDTAATQLGKLLADSATSGQPGTMPAKDVIASDDAPIVTGKQFKSESGPSGNFAAQIQSQITAGKASPFSGAPATTQQPLQSDPASINLHSTAFLPAVRTESASMPQFQVHTPAGQHVWAEDVGSRVSWMIGRGESKAELVLTPPHLGKLEISIQTNGDQTTAHFVAASAAARDALEQALPRLREVLQQAGINLGQTNVSTSSEQQARQNSSGQNGTGLGYAAGSNDADGSASTPPRQSFWMQTGTGMVDTFA